MKLPLDETYPARMAEALRGANIEAVTVSELALAGRFDLDVFGTAIVDGYVLLTENVADFARIAADHLTAGHHHPGVLIALSTRFSPAPPAPYLGRNGSDRRRKNRSNGRRKRCDHPRASRCPQD